MTEEEKLKRYLEQSGDEVDEADFNDMSESLDSSGEAVNPSSGETIYQEDYQDLQGALDNNNSLEPSEEVTNPDQSDNNNLYAYNAFTDTMNDAGGGLPARPNPNDGFSPNYRVPASLKSIPGLVNDGSDPISDYGSQLPATRLNPKLMRKGQDRFGMTPVDEPRVRVPEPVFKSTPQGPGSAKLTVKSNPFKPTPFKPSSGGYMPSVDYEEPTLLSTRDNMDKDANRQRLLAYLGMGTQDAITGMTGFQGNTNVYDQMILAANQKNKSAVSRQDKINNFIKQKNALKLAERGQDKRDKLGRDRLDYNIYDSDQKNKLKASEDQMKLEAENSKDISGTKRLNNIMAAGWDVYTTNGQGEATAIAIEEFKRGVKLLQSDPKFKPERLRNWLKSYNSVLPGEAKKAYPEMFALRQQVETALLPALKPTFGGAFTEGEGAKLDNTGFDPELPPEANIRAMNNWSRRLSAGYNETQRKMRYYSKNGYNMAGYTLQAPVIIERADDE